MFEKNKIYDIINNRGVIEKKDSCALLLAFYQYMKGVKNEKSF